MKVGVVGTGMVGSTAAFAIAMQGAANSIMLVDANPKRAEAEAEDIRHATPFAHGTRVHSGSYEDLADSRVVIIAAGVPQKPGESRLSLLERNAAVFAQAVPRIVAAAPEAVLVIATNPVDIMTHVAARLSGLPAGRVLGSGTILDTARFRTLLGLHLGISPKSIHAYVVGEHGDSEVLCWSSAEAGGIGVEALARQEGRVLDAAARQAIDDAVRHAAYRIIEGKGATWFGVGGGLVRIVQSVLGNFHSVLTVSTVEEDFAGLGPVALSLPRVVGERGVERTLNQDLAEGERQALQRSAGVLAEAFAALSV
jgi:L-lactate dehydrogenase